MLTAVIIVVLTSLPAYATDSAAYSNSFAVASESDNDDNVQLLRGIAYEDVVGRCEYIISDFNEDDGGWIAKSGIKRLAATTAVSVSPYKIFEGRRHLRVFAEDGGNAAVHTIEKTFDEPFDASGYNSFFAALNASCGDSGGSSCEITVSFYAGEETFERSFIIETGEISCVVVDISGFENRNAITGLDISFKNTDAAKTDDGMLLLLDYVALSESANLTAAVNFLSDRYVAGGGEVTVGSDCISFISGGDGAYIETAALEHDLPANANAVCIELANYAGAESMTFYYTTEDAPQYKSSNSCEIKLYTDSETHYYYIPVRSLNIMQFRIVFGGKNSGLVNIHMIRAVESFSYIQTEYGSIDSVAIAENKRDIVIRGSISADIFDIYRDAALSQNMPIALYCLDPGDDHTDIITLATSQIDQTGMKESFRFTVPLETDSYSRINCKFAVGITTSNGITLIDDCKYISNPEILADPAVKPVESPTKKAFCANTIISEELCADSYIEINLCRLLSSEASDIYTQSLSGVCYFNSAYVNQLDEEITKFARSDVSLTATLSAIPSDDKIINELIIPGSIQTRYTSSAFDVSNAESTAAIYNAVAFLVRRYSIETPVITGYIVGGNLCDSEYGYWSGRIPLTDYVSNYCAAYRVIYTAVKSTCSYPSVYIRMGYSWDDFSACSDIFGFSSRQLLDMIALTLQTEGDIGWSLAADVTREDEELYLSYNDSSAYESYSSETLSVKNMDMLCRYMELGSLEYNGEPRSLLVLDLRPVAKQAEIDRAEYIYSFIKLNSEECRYVKKYISNRDCENAETFDMLKYIDSSENFSEYADFALEKLAVDNWTLLIPSYTGLNELRTITETTLASELPLTVTGAYTLFDFSGMYSENGWSPSVNCSIISTGNEVMDHSALLTASLSRSENSNYRGIVNKLTRPLDFSAAPFVNFDMQIIGAARDVGTLKLIVTVYSGDDYIEFSGDIALSEWHKIALDLSSFDKRASVDKIKIWISDGGTDIASPTMMLSSIVVSSAEYDDAELEQLFTRSESITGESAVNGSVIWILTLIAVITATALVLHILSNNRKFDRFIQK